MAKTSEYTTDTTPLPTDKVLGVSDPAGTPSTVLFNLADLPPTTHSVGTSLGTTGTVNLDMAELTGTVQRIGATGNITFTTSNRTSGRTLRLIVDSGLGSRTITWPAWTVAGAAGLPALVPLGARLVVTVTFLDTTDEGAVATFEISALVGVGLGTSGTIDLDMAKLDGTYQTISLSGNPTFTTSNRAATREVTIKLIAGGSSRTLTFPSWIFVGAAAPTTLASGKVAIFTVTFFDTTDAAAVAAYSAQP